MKLIKRKSAVLRAVGAGALLALGTLHAFGQQIPASSADSGRRAVIAVNQGTIYNNINNAQNSANNAWNYANSAQNTANVAYNAAANAQAGADGAAGLAGEAYRRAGEAASGTVIGSFVDVIGNPNNFALFYQFNPGMKADQMTAAFIRVACVKGMAGPHSVEQSSGSNISCPDGSSFVAFSFSPGRYDAGGGGNGGGGAGGD